MISERCRARRSARRTAAARPARGCGIGVAPAPTGSSTTGMPRSRPCRARAASSGSTPDSSVPMLSTSAPAMPASVLHLLVRMGHHRRRADGEQRVGAMQFITTKLVMLLPAVPGRVRPADRLQEGLGVRQGGWVHGSSSRLQADRQGMRNSRRFTLATRSGSRGISQSARNRHPYEQPAVMAAWTHYRQRRAWLGQAQLAPTADRTERMTTGERGRPAIISDRFSIAPVGRAPDC